MERKCLSLKEAPDLKNALLFLHVAELQDVCEKLSLPTRGKKGVLVGRVMHFLTTGQIVLEAPVPKQSYSQKGVTYPLAPATIMRKGAYKNDLATRLFFKKLIGEHFHFTAFGIDWLNERWQEGTPPTYQEFAGMWKKEYAHRKAEGTTPKEEWAYINFVQKTLHKNPELSRVALTQAWEQERGRQVKRAQKIIREFLKK